MTEVLDAYPGEGPPDHRVGAPPTPLPAGTAPPQEALRPLRSSEDQEGPEKLDVIGDDDRVPADVAKYPAQAVCHLSVDFGSSPEVGTGVLIGPYVIATAAHNVVDYYHGHARIWATPAYDRRPTGFPSVQVAYTQCFGSYARTFRQDQDIACLFLAEPIGEQAGWFDVASGEEDELIGLVRALAVYGYDDTKVPPGRMWRSSVPRCWYDDQWFRHHAGTDAGTSGGPLCGRRDGDGAPVLVGVHVGTTRRDNYALRVNEDVASFLAYHRSWNPKGRR